MTVANTKSGEVISILLAAGISTGMVLIGDNPILSYIKEDCVAWIYIAYAYFTFGIISMWSHKFWGLSRFLSGVCWGTLILFMINFGKPYPLLFISTILFGFDVFIVVTKGKSCGKTTPN